MAHASEASRRHDENDLFDLHQEGLATDGAAVDVVGFKGLSRIGGERAPGDAASS